MSRDSNETKQHFNMRSLDQDMRDAYAEAFKVRPKEHVQGMKAQNKRILVLLAIIVVIIAAMGGHLLGAF